MTYEIAVTYSLSERRWARRRIYRFMNWNIPYVDIVNIERVIERALYPRPKKRARKRRVYVTRIVITPSKKTT